MTTGHQQPAGWYPDPQGGGGVRFWDGGRWTDQASSAGPAPPAAEAGNGMAVAALVLGIVGVVVALVPFLFWLGWILGILAIIFGALGRSRARKNPAAGRERQALAGLVLGIVAIVAGAVMFVVVVRSVGGSLSDFGQCLQNADTQAEIEACAN